MEAVDALLTWFAREQRDLPWRRQRDPWRVWVSEVMLQQTRVETVVPYFERFMERFPTPRSLAAAPEQEVLRFWQGLGYYRRARALRRAAQELDGPIPDDPETFAQLPGVGPYTLAAVQSLAFGRDLAAVDGNVKRVLARWHGAEGDVRRLATALLPAGRAGRWNEALMELGATVCLPRQPRCAVCPIERWCQKRIDLPRRRPRKPLPVEERTAVVASDAHGRWCLVQRPPKGLLAGLWEFPQLTDLSVDQPCEIDRFKHVFTHLVWQVTAYTGVATTAPAGSRWLKPEGLDLPLTTVARRVGRRVLSSK